MWLAPLLFYVWIFLAPFCLLMFLTWNSHFKTTSNLQKFPISINFTNPLKKLFIPKYRARNVDVGWTERFLDQLKRERDICIKTITPFAKHFTGSLGFSFIWTNGSRAESNALFLSLFIFRRVGLCVPWVDGRCMYFRPIRLNLLWTTNPIAACNDTHDSLWSKFQF